MKAIEIFLLSARESDSKVFLVLPGGVLMGYVVAVKDGAVQLTRSQYIVSSNISQWFKPDGDVFVPVSQITFWSDKDIRPLVGK